MWIKEKANVSIDLTNFKIWSNVIINPPNHIANAVALIIKQYIYRCKCAGEVPLIPVLQAEIAYFEKMELYNALKLGPVETQKVQNKWQGVKQKEIEIIQELYPYM